MMYKFQPTPPYELAVSGMGYVSVAPAAMVRKFGEPEALDEYKVSGSFSFVDEDGDYFVVADWKSTNLYSDDYPSPEEFWAGEEAEELSISSADKEIEDFKQWLLEVMESDREVEQAADESISKTSLLYLLQTGLGAVGLLIHIWTTWLAFNMSGFWSAAMHFVLFIYAECYWTYKMFMNSGINSYSLIAGVWVVAYLSILFLNHRQHKATD